MTPRPTTKLAGDPFNAATKTSRRAVQPNSSLHTHKLDGNKEIAQKLADSIEKLFDLTHGPTATLLKQVAELSKIAHALWLGLLALLTYCLVTLLTVEDKDFFAFSAKTTLPILNIQIGTTSFFFWAPFLIAASYIHLHLYLLRLWKYLKDLPPRLDINSPIADHVYPWLITYAALIVRPDGADNRFPFRSITRLLSILFLWTAAPAVLLLFWWRSMPAHNEWLTLGIGLLLIATLCVAINSGWTSNRLARKRELPREIGPRRITFTVLVAFIILFISWARTENWMTDDGFDQHYKLRAFAPQSTEDNRSSIALNAFRYINLAGRTMSPILGTPAKFIVDFVQTFNPKMWPAPSNEYKSFDILNVRAHPIPLAMTNIGSIELSMKPEDWTENDLAAKEFRASFVRRLQIEFGLNWQEEYRALYERPWEQGCAKDWIRVRNEYLSRIVTPNLEGADLRLALMNGVFLANARLKGAYLRGATINQAHLENANLQEVRMEAASLQKTNLQGANLNYATLQNTSLDESQLQDACLRNANLRNTSFWNAHLERATLDEANLEFARLWYVNLDDARLKGVQLRSADMACASLNRADFTEAHLEGARLWRSRAEDATFLDSYLVGAGLESIRFEGCTLQKAYLHGAILDRAVFCSSSTVSQEQLNLTVGDSDTVLPDGLYCWSCLPELPPLPPGATRPITWDDSNYLTRVLCGPGEIPQKVGRPATECTECGPITPFTPVSTSIP